MAYTTRELELYTKLFGLKEPFDVEEGLKDGSFVCAPAAAGSKYEQSPLRLMYVGRDLGGWGLMKGDTPEEMEKYVVGDGRKAAGDFIDGSIDDYIFHNNSKFWHLCRAIITLAGEAEDWHKRIVWSNVYKVSMCVLTFCVRK